MKLGKSTQTTCNKTEPERTYLQSQLRGTKASRNKRILETLADYLNPSEDRLEETQDLLQEDLPLTEGREMETSP